MNSNIKIPAWMVEGPDDIEYRTYKLRGTISDIKKKIADSNLMDALYAIDDALDYLYQYDAVKMTQDPNPMDQIVSGFEFPNLELVFTTDEEIETDEIIDLLLDEAIDSYENFTINEVGLMLESDQLDMLVEKSSTKKKIYVNL